MCDTCGCNITPGNEHLARQKNAQGSDAVTVLKNLLTTLAPSPRGEVGPSLQRG